MAACTISRFSQVSRTLAFNNSLLHNQCVCATSRQQPPCLHCSYCHALQRLVMKCVFHLRCILSPMSTWDQHPCGDALIHRAIQWRNTSPVQFSSQSAITWLSSEHGCSHKNQQHFAKVGGETHIPLPMQPSHRLTHHERKQIYQDRRQNAISSWRKEDNASISGSGPCRKLASNTCCLQGSPWKYWLSGGITKPAFPCSTWCARQQQQQTTGTVCKSQFACRRAWMRCTPPQHLVEFLPEHQATS